TSPPALCALRARGARAPSVPHERDAQELARSATKRELIGHALRDLLTRPAARLAHLVDDSSSAHGALVAWRTNVRGIRIGRVFGIDLVLDPSWILIFAFMTWNLAAMFARAHPSWTLGTPLALGVAAVVLFFASVLLHELAHSIVAIASGL